MAYTPTVWVNNQAPAINAANLNNMEQGIKAANDYIDNYGIVETGSTNGWTYTKYANGTFTAWWLGSIAVAAGTAWCGGYNHAHTYTLAPPSFATAITSATGTKQDGVVAICSGVKTMTTSDISLYWWNASSAAASGSAFGKVKIEITGTY